jgi:signal transduction histidine kinase
MKYFDPFSIRVLERSRSKVWKGIAIAGLLTVIAVLVRLALLGPEVIKTPYVTFYTLSTIAAVLGGWVGGIAATLFSALIVVGFFSPLVEKTDWISFTLFLGNGVLATAIVEMLFDAKMQAMKADVAKEALERRAAHDELLSRAATTLLKTRDPKSVVNQLCREISNFLQCEVFATFLLDERSERQSLFAYAGVSEQEVSAKRCLDCRSDPNQSAAQVCNGVSHRDDASGCPQRELFGSLGVARYCCHPLLEQGSIIGALMFGDRRPDFDPAAIDMMEAISHLISQALSRARAEERAQDATAKLREADQRKDEFLATLAHELRNPLAPIRSGLDFLKRSEDEPERRRAMIGIMERQVNSLVRLVDDLLEISRINRGKIELRKEIVDISAAVRLALEASQPLIDEASHRLTLKEPREPLEVFADQTRLAQVFANLLNNAAKFSPRNGVIEISAERQGGEAVVTVRDNGRGISPEALPHIFELFVQTGPAPGGGLGIGLALVRNLVELHGGTVSAQSAGLGKGSEFIVRLPLSEAAVAAAVSPDPPNARLSNRVLVIDDNKDAADTLCMALEAIGVTVHAAYDGHAGVAAIKDFMPDAVLLDLGMPGLNGYETAKFIRQMPEGRDLQLVAVTGWGQEDARGKAEEAAFDAHLIKPASLAAMQAVLSQPKNELV